MLKQTVLLLLSLIALTSALNVTETQSFFFVPSNNKLSYELFQTKKGVIGYSVEEVSDSHTPPSNLDVPQYVLMDLESKNVKTVLAEIMEACEEKASAFGRLHYHALTSTLVYYCTNNNTLLILDEEDYSTQTVIPINTNETFTEVKITSEEYSIVILGMGPLLSTNTTPSQLIKVSLQTREVINHITLQKGLASGEAVSRYASNGKASYILTTRVNGNVYTVNIYRMYILANVYKLTQITNFTTLREPVQPVNLLLCVGDYIITNEFTELVFFNTKGERVKSFVGMAFKASSGNKTSVANPALVALSGSSEFYVLFNDYTLSKFSVDGAIIKTELIANAKDMQIAIANKTSNSLLFTIDPTVQDFTIIDLKTSQLVYQTVAYYDDLMITDTTYCVYQRRASTLSIFNRHQNFPFAKIPMGPSYYHDQKYSKLYFLDNSTGSCNLKEIDLQTSHVIVAVTFNDNLACTGYFIQFEPEVPSIPEFVLALEDGSYLINSYSSTEKVIFKPSADKLGFYNTIVVNFTTLEVQHLAQKANAPNTTIYSYQYDTESGFNLTGSIVADTPSIYYYHILDEKKVVSFAPNGYTIIEPSSGSTQSFTTQFYFEDEASTFQDKSGNTYMVLSYEQSWTGINQPPIILDQNGLTILPGSSGYTIEGGAAGFCSYWTVDGMITSVGQVKFYDICSQEMIKTIYI